MKWQREAERTGVHPWVFAQSMSDIFDNEVPPEWRERAVARDTAELGRAIDKRPLQGFGPPARAQHIDDIA